MAGARPVFVDIEPDFLCIAKGLTAGWLPLSAVLTTNNIYELFYDHNNSEKTFWHSNTHYGNVLAASVAIETLNIIEEENLCNRAMALESVMLPMMQEIADSTQRLSNIRSIGAIVAADLIGDNLGLEIHKNAMNLGAYLRPIGNTIYWLPPLNTNFSTLEELGHITKMAITNLKRKRL
jgi:adenosylmethionine-8-amino-7-oxononanoate aminotransferase